MCTGYTYCTIDHYTKLYCLLYTTLCMHIKVLPVHTGKGALHSITIPFKWYLADLFHDHLVSFQHPVVHKLDVLKDTVVFCSGPLYLPRLNGILCSHYGANGPFLRPSATSVR